MSWRPASARSLTDPAWRLLGVGLVLPTAGQVASGNLVFPGELGTGGGGAWIACQVLALAGLVVGIRVVLDGRWRGAALAIGLAWVAAHVAWDLVLTDSFVRFGERVAIPRPWVFGEALPIGAWLAGMAVIGAGLAAMRLPALAKAQGAATHRVVLVGVGAMLRGR
jgi:hypothetical protein